MRTVLTAATAAVLALTLLTACTGDDSGSGSGAPPTSEPSARPSAVTASHSMTNGLTFPMERHEITDADRTFLEETRDQLIAKCMTRYGLTYVSTRVPETDNTGPYTYLYGVDDPVLAAEYGYIDPRDVDVSAGAPDSTRDLTADEALVLYGLQGDLEEDEVPATLEQAEAMEGPELRGRPVPVLGCNGDATLRINRPGKGYIDDTELLNLSEEAAQQADDDPRVKELLREWSRCMAEKGYRAKSPITARDDLKLGGDAKLKEAIRAAGWDVACKKRTDLVKRWSAVDAEYQERVIAEHRDFLRRFRAQHEERMARAKALRSS